MIVHTKILINIAHKFSSLKSCRVGPVAKSIKIGCEEMERIHSRESCVWSIQMGNRENAL